MKWTLGNKLPCDMHLNSVQLDSWSLTWSLCWLLVTQQQLSVMANDIPHETLLLDLSRLFTRGPIKSHSGSCVTTVCCVCRVPGTAPTAVWWAWQVIKKELVTDDEDIDWVQTEKHVFETASNHPFLVGLHSCFQSPSRLFFVIGECGRRPAAQSAGEKRPAVWTARVGFHIVVNNIEC